MDGPGTKERTRKDRSERNEDLLRSRSVAASASGAADAAHAGLPYPQVPSHVHAPTATHMSSGTGARSSHSNTDATTAIVPHSHNAAASTAPEDHLTQAQRAVLQTAFHNEELKAQTEQLKGALSHTLHVARNELVEQQHIAEAKVNSCEDQMAKLTSISMDSMEHARIINRDLKTQSDQFQNEAKSRADAVEKVKQEALQEVNALKRSAELEQQAAQRAVSAASNLATEATSSKEHSRALARVAESAVESQEREAQRAIGVYQDTVSQYQAQIHSLMNERAHERHAWGISYAACQTNR